MARDTKFGSGPAPQQAIEKKTGYFADIMAPTLPTAASATITSAQTAVVGSNWATFGAAACDQLDIVNTTGTTIEYRRRRLRRVEVDSVEPRRHGRCVGVRDGRRLASNVRRGRRRRWQRNVPRRHAVGVADSGLRRRHGQGVSQDIRHGATALHRRHAAVAESVHHQRAGIGSVGHDGGYLRRRQNHGVQRVFAVLCEGIGDYSGRNRVRVHARREGPRSRAHASRYVRWHQRHIRRCAVRPDERRAAVQPAGHSGPHEVRAPGRWRLSLLHVLRRDGGHV